MSVFDQVAKRVNGDTIARVASGVAAKYLPPYSRSTARAVIDGFKKDGLAGAMSNGITAAEGAAKAVLRGKLAGFLNSVGAGALLSGGGGSSGGASEATGNLTIAQAKAIFDETTGIAYARKNLWFITISEVSPLDGQGSVNINLFATDVSYTPVTITGDQIQVGSAMFDAPKGQERVEVSVTTLDDAAGTIKSWFNEKSAVMSRPDGTFGLPSEYLLKLEITHSFVTEDSIQESATASVYIVRPGTMELGLSRRDDALEEVQLTFVQHDNFSPIK